MSKAILDHKAPTPLPAQLSADFHCINVPKRPVVRNIPAEPKLLNPKNYWQMEMLF